MVLTLPLTSSLRLGPPGGEDPTNSQRAPRTRARGGDQTNEHCPASQSNLGVHVGTSGLGGNTLDCPSLVSQSEKRQPRKGRKEQRKPHHTPAAKPAQGLTPPAPALGSSSALWLPTRTQRSASLKALFPLPPFSRRLSCPGSWACRPQTCVMSLTCVMVLINQPVLPSTAPHQHPSNLTGS